MDNVEFHLRGLEMQHGVEFVLSLDIINMGMWTVSSAVCKSPSLILGC